MKDEFVIGVDFGTDSVRSVVVDARTGAELAASVFDYPRWRDGLYCDPSASMFRQHPLDYLEGLTHTVKDCVGQLGKTGSQAVRGISADTTGSSPVAVNEQGVPLSLLPGMEEDPDAMFVLWKDHTAVKEAAAINEHAAGFETNYLQFVGGIYSSEWFWAKLLHVLKVNKRVRQACFSWVEHCDWIPFVLTGGKQVSQMKRGVCAAGHKSLWAKEYGGLPPEAFFSSLHPLLSGFRSRLFEETYTSDEAAGRLSEEWAERLGLPAGITVGVGAFDAHMGAVGGQIEPYYLSKVMGTSTCDMLVAPLDEMEGKLVRGICGQVPGSVIPGMMGMEAGQSAFGDTYAWFRELLSWPLRQALPALDWLDKKSSERLAAELPGKLIERLSAEAESLPLSTESELAVDWLNGRRTPDANQELKAAVTGLHLGSDAPAIFRALAESTCFGARQITDRFLEEGVPVKGLIGLGGVAGKAPFIMQMLADVMNMPIRIHKTEQTCATGAAMFAATAAGLHPNVQTAMEAMGQGFQREYAPRKERVELFDKRYRRYRALAAFVEEERNG